MLVLVRLFLVSIPTCLLIFLSGLGQSYAWQGRVVGISDGDTIKVLHDGRVEKIRIYGIDAPEKGQAFGNRAKQFTSGMVFNKTIDVDPVDIDRYGRTVAMIIFEGENLSEEIIKAGYAWVYTKYCKDPICDDWNKYESDARNKSLGLWADKKPVPPWEWRRGKN